MKGYIISILLLIILISNNGCYRSHYTRGKIYQERATKLYDKAIIEYKKALEENPVKARIELGKIYYKKGEFKEAAEQFKTVLEIDKDNPTALKLLGLSYLKDGMLTQALHELERAAKIKPLDPELAYYIGFAYEKKNVFNKARTYYEKVLSLLSQGKLVDLAKEKLSEIERKTRVLTIEDIESEEVKAIIKHAPSESEFPNAGAIILLDEIRYTINPNNTSTTRIHRIIKILNDRGKHFAEVKISYDSTYETVKVLLARTIRPDGRLVLAGKKHEHTLTPWAGFPLYSNVKCKVISMPEVVDGSIIEYIALIESGRLINEEDFQICKWIQDFEPRRLQRLILTIPKGRDVKVYGVRCDIAPEIKETEDTKTYTWVIENTEEIISESNMPPLADISPIIMVSSFSSWKEIYDWWWNLAKDKIEVTDEIKEKVETLTRGCLNLEEKVRKIYYFVSQEIRYVGLEYGESGYIPNSAGEVFKNKYGDCKDQVILLVSMLRYAGASAYPVLISTRENGRLKKDIPMIQFDHCICAVHINDRLYFLDPTSETCSFGDLPGYIQDREAFIVYDDKYEFVRTPKYGPETNKIIERSLIRINPDDSIEVTSKIQTKGSFNMSFRELRYQKPIKREHFLKDIVNEMCPGAKLLEYSISDLEDLDKEVEIEMRYTCPNYVNRVGRERFFKIPGLSFSPEGFGKEERTYPISFATTLSTETYVEIILPKGYKVKYLPETVKMDLSYVSYFSRYEYKDEKVLFQEKYERSVTEIEPGEYSKYKDFEETIAKELKKQIILEEGE